MRPTLNSKFVCVLFPPHSLGTMQYFYVIHQMKSDMTFLRMLSYSKLKKLEIFRVFLILEFSD